MIKVKNYYAMGRGLYTTKKIKRGTLFMTCETIYLNEKDSKIVQKTLLNSYVYDAKYKNGSCLALGLGSLYNHDKNPNVEYNIVLTGHPAEPRCMIEYTTLRDIEPGEQLFIDYGYEP